MILPHGPINAEIMLVGEFPHILDIQKETLFVGGMGWELTKMLQEAGLRRDDLALDVVFPHACRIGKKGEYIPNNGGPHLFARLKSEVTPYHQKLGDKWAIPELMKYREELRSRILRVKPNVVLAMGNLALWALTGEWGVGDWRSSIMESNLVPGLKVIPTHNPQIINYAWKERPIIIHDFKRLKRESKSNVINRTEYKFVIRPNFDQAMQTLQWVLDQPPMELGVDIETRAGHMSCVAIAWSEKEAICIPLMQSGNPDGYWNLEEESAIAYLIYQISLKHTAVGQNFNYDLQYFLRHWCFVWPRVLDTMVMQHSCFSNLPKNLAFLSSMYLEDHLYWKDDRTNWTEGPKGEGEDKYWAYCATDAVRTLAISKVLKQVIKSLKLEKVNDFQQRLRARVLRALDRGVRVDHGRRSRLAMELMSQANERQGYLDSLLGEGFNIKSPKQMADFFYRQMGLKPIISKKTGGVTTDDAALATIGRREPILLPITKRISELRSLGVFHSTFVGAGLDVDGRMRTDYNVGGTETYRFNSRQNAFGTGMNMQNTPKGGFDEETGLNLPNIRELFIPDPGYMVWDIDLDSADLRIVTWESDCAWMKAQFKAGKKPYVEIMKEYYQDDSKSKNSPEYKIFKSLCHGTNYLGTADGIAPRIGLDPRQTQKIQDWYYKMCPEIKEWQESLKAQVTNKRYVENAFGYRIHVFDKIEGTIFNQMVAWIPQSSVAILINHIWEALEETPKTQHHQILLQNHDSLVGQCESWRGQQGLDEILTVANSVAIPYKDPLYIPVGIASSTESWGACG